MKLFNVVRWLGCHFGHSGKWLAPKQEAWISYIGERERHYSKTVQFRTCTECNAVEKRDVCSGR